MVLVASEALKDIFMMHRLTSFEQAHQGQR